MLKAKQVKIIQIKSNNMRNSLSRFQFITLLLVLQVGLFATSPSLAQVEIITYGKFKYQVDQASPAYDSASSACSAAYIKAAPQVKSICDSIVGCVPKESKLYLDCDVNLQGGRARTNYTLLIDFSTLGVAGVPPYVLTGGVIDNGINIYCAQGTFDFATNSCIERKVNYDSCTTKNPVNPGSGEKFFSDIDYQGAGAHPLDFQRLYQSNYKGIPSIANGWIHNWQRAINVINVPTVAGSTATAQHTDGKNTVFKFNGNVWAGVTNGRFDTLTEVKTNNIRTGWQLKIWSDDSTEHYSADGVLQKIVLRNGWTSTVTYSTSTTATTIAPYANLPITVTNHFGRKLELRYNNLGQLTTLVDPAGGQIKYSYDSSLNLTKVTWQDNTAKQYLYANPVNGRLTGIIDEMGVRVGTFAYDSQGRVLSSEKANGVEKLTFLYNADKSTSITDYTPSPTGVGAPTATTRVHKFGYAQGVVRPISVTAPCPVCGNTAASTAYDSSGNVSQRTEHDGSVTKLTYDSKNRELTRVEAFGTAAAKTYTTQWHATWNLPTLKIEPLKITAYTYDAKGNLTGQADTPTTDNSGALKAAAVRDNTKPIESTGWSYNANNLQTRALRNTQVKNALEVWVTFADMDRTMSYDLVGNEIFAKNNLNQKSRNATYNTDGLPVSGSLGAGLLFSYQYNSSGFLTKEKWGNDVTNIVWNKNGRPDKLQRPDGSYTGYKYDASGRYESETYYPGNGVSTVLIHMLNMLVGNAWAIPSDPWWGYTNPTFRDWAHKEFFNGEPSPTTKQDMDRLWKIWNEDGCPRGKGGKSGKGGSTRGGGRGSFFRGGARGLE